MAPISSKTRAAYVHQAKIIDVNIANWTVSVATQFADKPLTDIPFAVPYLHPNNGEGIYFMPEVGSVCWLCEPSDGNKPFVLAWAPPSVDGTGQFRAHRQDLSPGDIWLGTRDENFLILRRGGVVQIGGTGLCQRLFLPINNTIKDFCENYSLNTIGGDLEWVVKRVETDTTGDRPALLTLSAKAFANDEQPIATLKIGSHDGDKKTILSLAIHASGAQGADTVISLKMTNEGNVIWEVEKDVSLTIKGKVTVDAKGEVKFTAGNKFTLDVKDKLALKAKGIDVDAGGKNIDVKADKVTVAAEVIVNSGVKGVWLADDAFISWIATHTHTSAPTGSPTSPAVPPYSAVPGTSYATMLKAK